MTVAEPLPSGGTRKTRFLLESGARTGDGRLRGREGAILRKYLHGPRRRAFE